MRVHDSDLERFARLNNPTGDMARELIAARAVVEAARGWYCECAREIATNEEGQQAERVTECIMCVAIRNYDEAVK